MILESINVPADLEYDFYKIFQKKKDKRRNTDRRPYMQGLELRLKNTDRQRYNPTDRRRYTRKRLRYYNVRTRTFVPPWSHNG